MGLSGVDRLTDVVNKMHRVCVDEQVCVVCVSMRICVERFLSANDMKCAQEDGGNTP